MICHFPEVSVYIQYFNSSQSDIVFIIHFYHIEKDNVIRKRFKNNIRITFIFTNQSVIVI